MLMAVQIFIKDDRSCKFTVQCNSHSLPIPPLSIKLSHHSTTLHIYSDVQEGRGGAKTPRDLDDHIQQQ